jgi:hypothetical protein
MKADEKPRFEGVMELVFKEMNGEGAFGGYKWRRLFRVKRRSKVKHLISLLQLQPLPNDVRIGCIYDFAVEFRKPAEPFQEIFGEPCFGGYFMPPKFYAAFRRLVFLQKPKRICLAVLVVAALVMVLVWRFLQAVLPGLRDIGHRHVNR